MTNRATLHAKLRLGLLLGVTLLFLSAAPMQAQDSAAAHEVAVQASWARAAERYPDCSTPGTPLHNLMTTNIAEIAKSNRAFFDKPNWPEILVSRCAPLVASSPAKARSSPPPPMADQSLDQGIAASRARMEAKYPDLNQPGTLISGKVADIIGRMKVSAPKFFSLPDWPEILVETCAKELREHPPLYSESDVMKSWAKNLPTASKLDGNYIETAKQKAKFFDDLDSGRLDAKAKSEAARLNAPILRELRRLGGIVAVPAAQPRPTLDQWRDSDALNEGQMASRRANAGSRTKANFEAYAEYQRQQAEQAAQARALQDMIDAAARREVQRQLW
jgi:hypothetical protein